MIFGQRGGAPPRPSAAWPGVPLGRQRVFVPLDEQGQVWGTREHGQLFVQARRPHEPHEDLRGVHYEEMTVAELCRRLPAGAQAGLGMLGRRIDCAHPDSLNRAPAQVDLPGLDRGSRVRPADGTAWGLDVSDAQSLGGAELYEVVDTGSLLTGALVVVDQADADVVGAFERLCAEKQVGTPLQLWERRNLPGWFRKATRG